VLVEVLIGRPGPKGFAADWADRSEKVIFGDRGYKVAFLQLVVVVLEGKIDRLGRWFSSFCRRLCEKLCKHSRPIAHLLYTVALGNGKIL
jgi:hypothetical protein